MARQKIVYDVEFNSSAGVQKLKQELQSLKGMTLNDLVKVNAQASQKDLDNLKRSIAAIDTALDKSYNVKLNATNIESFNKSLAQSNLSLNQIATNLNQAGVKGQIAFNNMTSQLLTHNTVLKKSNSLLNSMATTLGNTLKWSIASGAIRAVTSGIREAWNYTVKLDTSLNDIRIVTGKSANEMEKFAKQANKAAKELGNSTTAYTKASLIYYQQGLNEDDVKARTDVTIKAANVTGQATAEVSEQLTAVWNGYKVAADEAERYVDKLAAVAASTAVDLEELSVGMSKVASSAHAMGVDIDQLTAQIATIGSVTRQDTSIVGTALKTIFARMGDLKVDGVDEFGVQLGDVTSKMQQMGIQVLDSNGDLRDMGSIIEEVAKKWGTWTQAQQQAAAVALAGKRQYNNLIALFENWDMYEKALTTSEASEGTLQKQQKIYMDSLQAHLDQLRVSGEKVYDALFDSESMKDLIDGLTTAGELFAGFIDSIGGGGQLLANFGAIALTVFNKQISNSITRGVHNISAFMANTKAVYHETQQVAQSMASMKQSEIPGQYLINSLKAEELKYSKFLSAEERNKSNAQIEEITNAKNKLLLAQEELKVLEDQEQLINDMYASKKVQNRVEKGSKEEQEGKKVGSFLPGYHIQEYDFNKEEDRLDALRKIEMKRESTEKLYENPMDVQETLTSDSISTDNKIGTAEEYVKKGGDLDNFIQKAEESGEYEESDLKALTEARQEANRAVKEYHQSILDLVSLEEQLKELNQSETATEEQKAEQMQKIAQQNVSIKEKEKNAITAVTSANSKHNATIDKKINLLNQQEKFIKKYPSEMQKVKNAEAAANKELEKAVLNYRKFLKETKTKALVNNITSVTTGIVQMASAVSSLKNLGNIFNDEDMTSGEKFLAIVQNLGMNIPMLVGGFGSFIKVFSLFGSAQSTVTALTKAFNAEQLQSMILQEGNNKTTIRSQIVNLGFATSQEIKDKSTEEVVESLTKEQLAQLAAIIMTKNATKANIIQTGSEEAKGKAMEKAGTKGFLAGLKIQLGFWPILVIGLAIAAVLATIIALFVIFSKRETEAEKAAKALEKEKESLAALNEEYKNLNEEIQNVTDKFEKLNEQQKVINDLQVGTEEWTKAVRENNQAVLELLSSYSELAPYIFTDTNGVMSISAEGQEVLSNKLRDKANKTYSMVVAQQRDVLAADSHSIKENLKDNNVFKDVISAQQQDLQKEYDEAVKNGDTEKINSLKPLLSSRQVSAGMGSVRTEQYVNASKVADNEINKLIDAYESGTNITQDLIDTYGEEADVVGKQIAAIVANTEASKNLEAAFAAAYFQDDADRNNAYSVAAWDAIAGDRIAKGASSAQGFEGVDGGDSNTEADKLSDNAAKYYAETLGTTADQLEYKDGKVKKKGADDSTYISIQDAAERAKEQYAASQLNTADVSKIVNIAYGAADEAGAASLINLAGGKTSVALDADTTTIADTKNLDATKDAMFKALREKGGYKDNDAVAQALGYKNYDDYLGSFTKTKRLAETSVDKLSAGHLNSTFNAENFQSATLTQAKNIADSIESVFQSGGTKSANALNEMLQTFKDPKTQEKVAQIAASIDWTDLNAENKFKAALEDANISIDTQSSYWRNIVKSMEDASNVAGTIVNKFNTIRKDLAEIKALSEDISHGDIVSDEDYQNIIKYNSEAKDLFIQTADGYKFIGSSGKELKKVLSDGYKDLDTIKKDFTDVNTAAASAKSLESDSFKFEVAASNDKNKTTANKIQEVANYGTLLAANGINKDSFDAALNLVNNATDEQKASEEYKNSLEIIKNAISAVGSSITSYENGAYSPDKALETWISYNANSWSDAKSMLAAQGYGSDTDLYEKFEKEWTNAFLQDLGFEGLTTALGADELETHLKNLRKLELDYYKEIEKELDILDLKTDKAFGADKIDNLNSKLALKKQSKTIAENQYNDASSSFNSIVSDFLANDDTNFGMDFSDGSGGLDITKLLNYQATLDEDSEEYKNIQNILDMYDKVGEAEMKAAEAAWAVIDAQIESFKYQQEVVQQFYDFQKSWLEFGQEFRSYAAEGLSMFESKKAADLISDAFESYTLNYSATNDFLSNTNENSPFSELIKAINGQNSVYKGTDAEGNTIVDEAALQADFEEAIGTAQDRLMDLQDNLQALYDGWMSSQEELMALYDTEIEKLSNINDIIRTQVDLRKTVAKITKTDYSSYSSYSKIAENAEDSFALAQTQLAKAQIEYNKVMALGDKASKEMIATVTENLVNAQNTVMTEGSTWVEAVTTMYSEAMSETINSFIKDAIGMDLEGISEAWEFATANDERYLDSINSAYAEESLMRKFETSIDGTDSIVAQNKLKEKQLAIEQKLTRIREEQGKLSQYDLDRANAEYELTLKQIALEEAQQTANKMKLTRDASGNYSYQYVADQDAIAKAEEELAAAQNELYNLDKERNKSLVEDYYSIWSEYQSRLAEAEAAGDTDRVARLNEYYQELLGGVQTELSLAEDNLTEIGRSLAGSDWTSSFADFTSAIQNANLEEVFGDLNSLTSESAVALKSMAEDIEAVMAGSAMTTALNSLSDNVKDSADLVTEAANIMDATADVLNQLPGLATSVESLSTQLKNYADIYKQWVEDNTDGNEAPEELEENTDALRALTQAAIGLADKWDGEENGKTTFNGVNWTLGSDNIWTQDAMDDDNT